MSTSNGGSIGILGILGVVFVTLKLTGHIDWSWWYVTMPFWGGFVLCIFIFFIFVWIEARKRSTDPS
ncbi:hypothetical protein [Nitrosomonas ureae]|uniref:Transmembrane Fragile-X-F protein n=1 Tax=Nitrosomonas ureae TaxID=44577 RepID=A0A1H2EPS9_9PROT|nr:hypothetical protein [Nitrosomonas ureae]ALQ51888.1 hypothetical protein ATY38_12070 [Nitrosomonas ureae]SDT97054.1 hypothetical protein SAMN05216406_11457 [Nitrosomonas ureae]